MISKDDNFGGASTKSDANSSMVKWNKRYNLNSEKVKIVGAANARIIKRKRKMWF